MNQLAIFAHFDHENKIRDYVVYHIKALYDAGIEVVFISNSQLNKGECARIQAFVSQIIKQPQNIGFDFFIWGSYIKTHKEKILQTDRLILTNSSVIGPIFPIRPIIDSMSAYPVWGMTENYDTRYHVQSYFMAFNKNVLHQPFFWDYFENIIPFTDIQSVISAYEITWAHYFSQHGYKPAIFSPPHLGYKKDTIIKLFCFSPPRQNEQFLSCRQTGIAQVIKIRSPIDPCYAYALPLIKAGMPYIKVKLFGQSIKRKLRSQLQKHLTEANISMVDMSDYWL
jgi:hypothetical protein